MPGTHLDEQLTHAQPVKPVLASTDVSPPLQPHSNIAAHMTSQPGPSKNDQGKSSQLKGFVEDDRHFNLVRCVYKLFLLPAHASQVRLMTWVGLPPTPPCSHRNFRLADVVTLLNGVCGSLSVFNSAQYLMTSDRAFLW